MSPVLTYVVRNLRHEGVFRGNVMSHEEAMHKLK